MTEQFPINIITYNILSHKLGNTNWFTSCKYKNLKKENRFKKITNQLQDEIKKSSIICLQEVPQDWAVKFHTLLIKYNYSFVYSSYGTTFDGYMGVGIAFPLNIFELCDADISRIGEDWPQTLRPTTFEKARKQFEQITNTISSWVSTELSKFFHTPLDLNWAISKKRNSMVSLKLKQKSTNISFWVATYHMPCAFKYPEIMNVHCALCAKKIQCLSKQDEEKGLPYVLCGDFNQDPNQSGYKLITSGGQGDYKLPELLENNKHWSPILDCRLNSAYKLHNGTEPSFTNWAVIRNGPPFIETLDYIFLSPHFNVKSVKQMPSKSDVNNPPLPNDIYPSDHLMIGAELYI